MNWDDRSYLIEDIWVLNLLEVYLEGAWGVSAPSMPVVAPLGQWVVVLCFLVESAEPLFMGSVAVNCPEAFW